MGPVTTLRCPLDAHRTFRSDNRFKAIRYPSLGSCISKLCGPRNPGLPPTWDCQQLKSVYLFPGYQGAAYLGGAFEPFDVSADIRYLHHTYQTKIESPMCFRANGGIDESRARARSSLMASLDQLRRDVDNSGMMTAMDAHHQSALSLVFGGAAIEPLISQKSHPKLQPDMGQHHGDSTH